MGCLVRSVKLMQCTLLCVTLTTGTFKTIRLQKCSSCFAMIEVIIMNYFIAYLDRSIDALQI